jgi:hypothetical protein
MRAEAIHYSVKEMKLGEVLDSYIVYPGNWKGIDSFEEGVKIAVFCNRNRASILIVDPQKKLSVLRSDDLKDLEGISVDNYSKMKIFDNEVVSITLNDKNVATAFSIYLNHDDQKPIEVSPTIAG